MIRKDMGKSLFGTQADRSIYLSPSVRSPGRSPLSGTVHFGEPSFFTVFRSLSPHHTCAYAADDFAHVEERNEHARPLSPYTKGHDKVIHIDSSPTR